MSLKISYLFNELHGLEMFEIRFGDKVHTVNTFYVNRRAPLRPWCVNSKENTTIYEFSVLQ